MFKSFSDRRIEGADGVMIRVQVAGDGPPVLLLHGYPQTHVCWHAVAPQLVAAGFTVVVADLRGYGDSDKPPSAGDHAPYSKRAMAADQVAVMARLGFPQFSVAGHDRGGRVAHRMARDHPQTVERLAVLDIAPTATMYDRTDRAFATGYYHWFFLIQPAPYPETLIGADPEFYLRTKLATWFRRNSAGSTEAAFAEYLRCFSDPACISASCEDYRASAGIDLEHDAADAVARLSQPVLALWGARGLVGQLYDVIQTWDEVAGQVQGQALDCGHYLPEERPDETAALLANFFRPAAGTV